MTAFLVFNDLSVVPIWDNKSVAIERMGEFASVLVDSRIKGKKALVVPDSFLQFPVASGFSIGRWLAELTGGDRERRLRIKTLVDRRSLYAQCAPLDDIGQEDVEYTHRGNAAIGLFIALSLEGLAISLWTSDQWDCSQVDLEKSWIEGDEVQSRVFEVRHCCRAPNLGAHEAWLTKLGQTYPENGIELWSDRLTFFPSLDFCNAVETQIKPLGANCPRFRAVLRGLIDLQRYCDSWTSGGFDIHKLTNASGESESTLNMYSEERTFQCPDGEFRIFQWHLKRGDTRIHFFDFPEERRILVGYAGNHLRISSQ